MLRTSQFILCKALNQLFDEINVILISFIYERLEKRLDHFWEPYYAVANHWPDNNPLTEEVNQIRVAWRQAYHLQKQFVQKTESTVGWLKSCIPYTTEFSLRVQLSETLQTANALLANAQQATFVLQRYLPTKINTKIMNAPAHVKTDQPTRKVDEEKYIRLSSTVNTFFFTSKKGPKKAPPEEFYYFNNKLSQMNLSEKAISREVNLKRRTMIY